MNGRPADADRARRDLEPTTGVEALIDGGGERPVRPALRHDPPAGVGAGTRSGRLRRAGDRLRRVRDRLRAHPVLRLLYRIGVAVFGVCVIALGVLLLPLPGPGWLVVFLGLGTLATEFAWAERLLRFARRRVRVWSRWIARQRLAVKAVFTVGAGACVVVVVTAYLQWAGVPAWVPFVR